jgi:hypothetical protein
MSIQNALVFFRDIESDTELRKSFYTCKTRGELLEMLDSLGRGFTYEECENAVNTLLLKCQSYEQADRVKELQSWFLLFPA